MSASSRWRDRQLAIARTAAERGFDEAESRAFRSSPLAASGAYLSESEGRSNRIAKWAVCVVGWTSERTLVIVAPGDPLRVWRAIETDDDVEAELVVFAISELNEHGEPTPRAGSCPVIRKDAEEALAQVVDAWGRGSLARAA